MSRKMKAILLVLTLVAVALCGFCVWRLFRLIRYEKMEDAVWEAWSATYSDDAPAYLLAIDRESYFTLEKIEKGNPCVLVVTVYGIDLGGKLRQADPADFPDTEDEGVLNDYLLRLIDESEYTEVQTYLYAWPTDDGYRIQFSDTFVDAMTGMVYSYTRDLADEMTGGTEK